MTVNSVHHLRTSVGHMMHEPSLVRKLRARPKVKCHVTQDTTRLPEDCLTLCDYVAGASFT